MQSPIPTPFDIVSLPRAAWIPSPLLWLSATALTILFLWWASHDRFKRAPGSISALLRGLVRELEKATRNTTDLDLARISRITRRIASQYVHNDLAGLSSHELRALADTLFSQEDRNSARAAPILGVIAELEELAYAPRGDDFQSKATELIRSLLAHVGTLTGGTQT